MTSISIHNIERIVVSEIKNLTNKPPKSKNPTYSVNLIVYHKTGYFSKDTHRIEINFFSDNPNNFKLKAINKRVDK